MDHFEGRCWLEWWANPATMLGSGEATVVITTGGTGWQATGHLVSDTDADRAASHSFAISIPCSCCGLKTTARSASTCTRPVRIVGSR